MVLEIFVGVVFVMFLWYLYKNTKDNNSTFGINTTCKKCGYEKGFLKCPYCRE